MSSVDLLPVEVPIDNEWRIKQFRLPSGSAVLTSEVVYRATHSSIRLMALQDETIPEVETWELLLVHSSPRRDIGTGWAVVPAVKQNSSATVLVRKKAL